MPHVGALVRDQHALSRSLPQLDDIRGHSRGGVRGRAMVESRLTGTSERFSGRAEHTKLAHARAL
jgi:hypothetical protein